MWELRPLFTPPIPISLHVALNTTMSPPHVSTTSSHKHYCITVHGVPSGCPGSRVRKRPQGDVERANRRGLVLLLAKIICTIFKEGVADLLAVCHKHRSVHNQARCVCK